MKASDLILLGKNILDKFPEDPDLFIVTDSNSHGEVIATEIMKNKIFGEKIVKKGGKEANIVEVHLK